MYILWLIAWSTGWGARMKLRHHTHERRQMSLESCTWRWSLWAPHNILILCTFCWRFTARLGGFALILSFWWSRSFGGDAYRALEISSLDRVEIVTRNWRWGGGWHGGLGFTPHCDSLAGRRTQIQAKRESKSPTHATRSGKTVFSQPGDFFGCTLLRLGCSRLDPLPRISRIYSSTLMKSINVVTGRFFCSESSALWSVIGGHFFLLE